MLERGYRSVMRAFRSSCRTHLISPSLPQAFCFRKPCGSLVGHTVQRPAFNISPNPPFS